MIKESGKVEQKYPANAVGGDAIPSLKTKKSGGVGSREEFTGAKLSRAQEVVTEVEGAKTSGDNFLKKFSVTFEEINRAVGFRKGVVWFLWFGDDYNLRFAPGVEMEM